MTPLVVHPGLILPAPVGDEIHVWQLDLDEPGWQLLWPALATDEEQRALRFLQDHHARRYRSCRAALRHLLAACAGDNNPRMLITYGPYGKPQLESGALHFNVSHSAGHALIAVATTPLGVDIETLQREGFDIHRLAPAICTPAELLHVQALPAPQRAQTLLRLWTQKEAWSKALGCGLQQDFSRTRMQPEVPADHRTLQDGSGLHVHTLPLAEAFCISLCHAAAAPLLKLRRVVPGAQAGSLRT